MDRGFIQTAKDKIQRWENALFGKSPPTLPTISWPLIVLIFVIGLIIPIISVRMGKMLNMPQILITLASSALTLLLTWGALRLKQLQWRAIGLTLKDFPKEVTIGISFFLVFETVRILMLLVQGKAPSWPVEPSAVRILDAAGQAFLCAATEEVFCRGLAISFLLSRFKELVD